MFHAHMDSGRHFPELNLLGCLQTCGVGFYPFSVKPTPSSHAVEQRQSGILNSGPLNQ